jgi:predicted metal-dependent hydrolase
MTTEPHQIMVNGLAVDVVRKGIKHLHLGVYPPQGRVRVAAPLAVDDDAVRLAVVDKFAWIKRQQAKFQAQARQSQREMVSGESHYFLGQRYRLRITEQHGPAKVELRGGHALELYVRPETSGAQREQVLQRWYREQLKDIIPPLLERWQAVLDVHVADWRIKRMKTKWGACNVEARRIWLNLELTKKPPQCLEYIVAHELTHLLERQHNERFLALLDRSLPHWRLYRDELNRAPLAHEEWVY